jgi:hypothetical protein
MNGERVSVAVVDSRVEADLIVGLLSSHGLRADVVADDAGGQEPQLQLEGVQVVVARRDEAEARRLLSTVDGTA